MSSLPGAHTWSELGARLFGDGWASTNVAVERASADRGPTPKSNERVLCGRVPEGDLELALRPSSSITLADVALAGAVLAMGAEESYDGPASTPVSVLTLELTTPIHVALRVQAKRSIALAESTLVAAKRGKPGDARIDPHYDVWAEEPEQANAFLAALPARDVLPAIDATGWKASFDSRRVTLFRPGAEIRVEVWRAAIETACRLARRLHEVAATIPLAEWRGALVAWEPACTARGLVRCADGSYAGAIDGRAVRVAPSALAGKRSTTLECRFAAGEKARVRLLPQSGAALVAHGIHDLKIGDPKLPLPERGEGRGEGRAFDDFDSRFIVMADSVEIARNALSPELRQSLAALQGRGIVVAVESDRARFDVPTIIDDPDALGRGLDELLRLTRDVAAD